MAKEKILSILQHVSNVHSFPSFQYFKQCEHGPLHEQKPWIAPGSKAMQKLREAVCGKSGRNLDDLTHMTGKNFERCIILFSFGLEKSN